MRRLLRSIRRPCPPQRWRRSLTVAGTVSGISFPPTLHWASPGPGSPLPCKRCFSSLVGRGGFTTAVAFDIDGVLIRGRELIPQAREALHLLATKEMGGKGSLILSASSPSHSATPPIHCHSHQQCFSSLPSHSVAPLPFIFLTNGGGVSEARKAAELSEWFGLRIPSSIVCVSHTPMQSLLPTHRHSRILVLGMSDVKAVAKAYGFTSVVTMAEIAAHHPELVPHLIHEETGGGEGVHPREPLHVPSPPLELASIKAAIVMHDPNCWYRDMQCLLDVMTASPSPPPLLFSNPDFLFTGRASSPRLAQGAFRLAFSALYREYTGKELSYQLMGKPEAITFNWAKQLMRTRATELGYADIDRCVMIGDNPAADIRGGNRAGWETVLVRTGTIKPSQREEDQPSHTAGNVLEAVKWIIDTEKRRGESAVVRG